MARPTSAADRILRVAGGKRALAAAVPRQALAEDLGWVEREPGSVEFWLGVAGLDEKAFLALVGRRVRLPRPDRAPGEGTSTG